MSRQQGGRHTPNPSGAKGVWALTEAGAAAHRHSCCPQGHSRRMPTPDPRRSWPSSPGSTARLQALGEGEGLRTREKNRQKPARPGDAISLLAGAAGVLPAMHLLPPRRHRPLPIGLTWRPPPQVWWEEQEQGAPRPSVAPATTRCSHPLLSALLLKGKGRRRQVWGCPATSGSRAPGFHRGGNVGQTRGSNSVVRGSPAAPSPNPALPSHAAGGRGIGGQARDPRPRPTPGLGDLALLRSAGRGAEEEEAPRGSFATQPAAPGPLLPALWARGRRPRAPRDPAPPPPRRGAQGATRASRGAEGGAGLGRGPAADRGHLRVLLREAVG